MVACKVCVLFVAYCVMLNVLLLCVFVYCVGLVCVLCVVCDLL